MAEVDFGKFNHSKLGKHNWLIVHTIFDELCWRSIHRVLSPKELTYFKHVFDSSELHFFAFNQKQIYLYKMYLEYGQDWPSLIILRLQTGNIIGLEAYSFKQEKAEQLLSIGRNYLKNLTLYVTEVGDSASLYQKFNNFDKVEELYYAASVLGDQQWEKFYCFDYSSIKHWQLTKLAMQIYGDPSNKFKLINYPVFLTLDLLVLLEVEIPIINNWNIKKLVF